MESRILLGPGKVLKRVTPRQTPIDEAERQAAVLVGRGVVSLKAFLYYAQFCISCLG